MFKQLPLSMPLSAEATFDNYYLPESNRATVDAIQLFMQQRENFFYLWGVGSGVSHVLQAIQHDKPELIIQYLPLKELVQYPAEEVLTGLEAVDVVILDDLQYIAGNTDWERETFHLYNRLRDAQKRLVVGSQIAPRGLPIQLADLQSRLQWGISYSLQPLTDEDKRRALLLRSQNLGLRMSDEVVQFMLNHYSRDLRQLMVMLNKMDEASLSEQRHLTVPFVKQVIGTI
ncbi:MAG: DnaA family protein [Candidatus Endobugula sp.]|jgi:DnaA family protein